MAEVDEATATSHQWGVQGIEQFTLEPDRGRHAGGGPAPQPLVRRHEFPHVRNRRAAVGVSTGDGVGDQPPRPPATSPAESQMLAPRPVDVPGDLERPQPHERERRIGRDPDDRRHHREQGRADGPSPRCAAATGPVVSAVRPPVCQSSIHPLRAADQSWSKDHRRYQRRATHPALVSPGGGSSRRTEPPACGLRGPCRARGTAGRRPDQQRRPRYR
jgi:hypothetical protein